MKFLALHLPQFHRIPENDEWWGDGFTEWDNVRRAKPIFKGHQQPRIPYAGYYYDLSKKEDVDQQAKMAHEYELAGFIYYHYWFGGKMLLQKPCEILLGSPEIDIEYCFCWANEPWSRAWDGKDHDVLMSQSYGGKRDWVDHFEYLLPFFKDSRYIKQDGKPMFYVYSASKIPCFDDMIALWNALLRENGFSGIYLVEFINMVHPSATSRFSQAVMEFEPMFTNRYKLNLFTQMRRFYFKKTKNIDFLNYDDVWRRILRRRQRYDGRKIIRSAFVDWDNSPRKGKNSTIFIGANPAKFSFYLRSLTTSGRPDASEDYIVINAWNEWGEGATLEPCERLGFSYLEQLKLVATENR